MEDYLICFVVYDFDYLVVGRDVSVQEGVLEVLGSVLEVSEPSGVGLVVFEGDRDGTLFLVA